MKVDKATAKYMLEVRKGWDSSADIGGEEVEEGFTAGYKQARIKALDEFIRITTLPMEGAGVWVTFKAIRKLDYELEKLRSE